MQQEISIHKALFWKVASVLYTKGQVYYAPLVEELCMFTKQQGKRLFMCNVMQVDNALYLNSNRITQEGMDTQYRMGHACSRKTSNIVRSQLSKSHEESLEEFFHQAIENEWVLVLIIDDFTKVHTYRRPATLRTCNPTGMCTIVVKAFKQLRAIKVPSHISRIHFPDGVNIPACVDTITSPEQLELLSNSYTSTMSDWLTTLVLYTGS